MPPQPLSYVRANVGISLTSDGFDQRPLVAQGIAQCIAYWSWVETQKSRLFISLLGANEEAGAALYNSLDSIKAKNAAIKSVAISALKSDDVQLLEALLRLIKSQQKVRDKIAHWTWGLPTELSDSMVIVDPKTLISRQAYQTENSRNEIFSFNQTDLRIPDDDIFVYSHLALQQDANNFKELALLINKFIIFCGLPQTSDIYSQLRAEITTNGHLDQFLSQ